MAEKLKDRFLTRESISDFADLIKEHYTEFKKNDFINLVFDDEWEEKELKARWRHIAVCMKEVIKLPYEQTITVLKEVAPKLKSAEALSLSEYVEIYGLEDWDTSLDAMRCFTQYSSSEFAIRPYIKNDLKRAMEFMLDCADDGHENVRRFASEGCRPRLPWAMVLHDLVKDPSPIFPILEKLKDDESEFVRKSVANNLNDISKDHPDLMLDVCEKWYGRSKNTDWIIKHACRTLFKKGNKRALLLFGYVNPDNIKVTELNLEFSEVAIGGELKFAITIDISAKEPTKVRMEYAIDYMKANGKHSRKVFKLMENDLEPGKHTFKRKHSFEQMTTRKHYPGEHKVSIMVNGDEKAVKEFTVKQE